MTSGSFPNLMDIYVFYGIVFVAKTFQYINNISVCVRSTNKSLFIGMNAAKQTLHYIC